MSQIKELIIYESVFNEVYYQLFISQNMRCFILYNQQTEFVISFQTVSSELHQLYLCTVVLTAVYSVHLCICTSHCTWSSIFLCSWTILFSMPVLSFFRCSADRASIFSCLSCRLACMRLYAHWMMMAAARARLNFLLCSQPRTHFWMIMALWCSRNCREREFTVSLPHRTQEAFRVRLITFHLKLETLCLQFTRQVNNTK